MLFGPGSNPEEISFSAMEAPLSDRISNFTLDTGLFAPSVIVALKSEPTLATIAPPKLIVTRGGKAGIPSNSSSSQEVKARKTKKHMDNIFFIRE
jgi:hypothetical protein